MKGKTSGKFEVCVIGGGFAGMASACLLGAREVKTALVDEAKAPPYAGVLRTTALSHGSKLMLEEAGIWKFAGERACPIENIEVLEGDSPVLMNLLTSEAGGKTFGWVILNSDLRAAMMRALEEYKSVARLAPASAQGFSISEKYAEIDLGDQKLQADLVIGADGRFSFVREFMSVRTREWKYRQRGIVCCVTHENPHKNAAVEHFMEEGPFAILPMIDDENGAHRSAVIVTEHGLRNKSRMKLGDEEFLEVLRSRFPVRYGHIRLSGGKASHDLSHLHAASYTAPRMALVADAAHAIHPVAGQGLNLGFRDVRTLANLIADAHDENGDAGSPELLAAYERARRFDNTATSAAMDALARLSSIDLAPVRALRRTGLRILSKMPAARRFILKKAMGDKN